MISEKNGVFKLDTAHTTYLFRISRFGHLEHIYYGAGLDDTRFDLPAFAAVLAQKRTIAVGSSVLYDSSDNLYCLDQIPLEWSDNGRGDYRQSPSELRMPDGSYVSDFVYVSHTITEGANPMKTLPSAYDGDQTLCITMRDTTCDVSHVLVYAIFEQTDVLTRRAVLMNQSDEPLVIRRLMSMMLDLPDTGFRMLTLDGAWIKEAHLHEKPLTPGITINSSTTGSSSNRHNPGFMLAASDATEATGHVYGFNLVYSGNHYGTVEKTSFESLRVSIGINPHCFEWHLAKGESFETPEAVLTFSACGLSGMSQQLHRFVNNHIVRGSWKNRERPVLINNWEAHFFDFDQGKLLNLAKDAKKLGIELLVLDDGWFGERNSDKAGLGDYTINPKKFPQGLAAFAEKIRALGLDFGLWFEPEMVNPDSELYRTHPEYALTHPKKKAVLGRNQLVLDLCQKDVRDYIVKQMGAILDDAKVSYVKWDMNRHIAEGYSTAIQHQGEFYHRYILGLYDILSRIFELRPEILLESCSSGGNRFDLGMLCYSPQIWCSDNTDPVERLKIQAGLSTMYPLSAMGAHVSDIPHQQTLRRTPLSTRFHVACFGCLGYELDLKYLSSEEKKDIADQIAFYKQYRGLFQFGSFSRIHTDKTDKTRWQCVSKDRTIALSGFFQGLVPAAAGEDCLYVSGLSAGMYYVKNRLQRMYLERFGGLMKHILPVSLNPNGIVLRTANRYYTMTDCMQQYTCTDAMLSAGIPLRSQYSGTGYKDTVRMLGDFGSEIYIITKLEAEGLSTDKRQINFEYSPEDVPANNSEDDFEDGPVDDFNDSFVDKSKDSPDKPEGNPEDNLDNPENITESSLGDSPENKREEQNV